MISHILELLLRYQTEYKKFSKMDDIKIFGIYSLNLSALAFSFSEINPFLQMLVLLTSFIFTLIQIIKAIKK